MRTIVGLVVAMCVAAGTAHAAGTVDETFSNGALIINAQGRFSGGYRSEATSIVALDDYRMLVAGTAWYSGGSRPVIAKVNRDGTLDQSFGSNGLALPYTPGWSGIEAHQISVWADGHIMVSGSASINSTMRMYIMRLNADGSLDTTFAGTGYRVLPIAGLTYERRTVLHALVPYGKVVVAGVVDGGNRIDAARVDWNGNNDLSYSGTGTSVRRVSNSTITAYTLKAMIYTSRGEVIIGASTYVNGRGPEYSLFRVNYAGETVQVIVPQWELEGTWDLLLGGVAEDTEGQLVLSGSASERQVCCYGGIEKHYALVQRLSFSTSFGGYYYPGYFYTPSDPAAGTLSFYSVRSATLFSFPNRYHADGTSIATIGEQVVVGATVDAGYFAVAQFEPDGAFDTDFSGDGKVQVKLTTTGPDEVRDLDITRDNLVVAAGAAGNYMAVVRLR